MQFLFVISGLAFILAAVVRLVFDVIKTIELGQIAYAPVKTVLAQLFGAQYGAPSELMAGFAWFWVTPASLVLFIIGLVLVGLSFVFRKKRKRGEFI